MKNKGGRPSKMTPEVKERLLKAIVNGHYYVTACKSAGVSYSAFYSWMQKGQQQSSPNSKYVKFVKELQQAEAQAEMRMVEIWQSHTPTDWRACRDFLERRFPERWGVKNKVEVSGKDGQPVQLEVTEARKALLDSINKALDHKEESATVYEFPEGRK